MIQASTRYFDLQSERKAKWVAAGQSPDQQAPVLPQYLTVSAGVVLAPILNAFATDGSISWGTLNLPLIIMGLVIGIILLPTVYRASFDTDKPISVQLAALFPLGFGWQSMFTTATAMATGVAG